MKEFLSTHQIPYRYIDICESVFTLRPFLQLRETEPLFAPVRAAGGIGIPALVVDGEVCIEPSAEWLRSRFLTVKQ